MKKDSAISRVLKNLLIVLIAIGGALNYEIFVFPNNFAAAGLNGILIIIRHLFGFTFGYLSLILNIPLLIVSWFFLKKRFAITTFIYVVSFSVASIILKNFDLSSIAFYAQDGGEKIMAAIAAGVFNGAIYSVALRLDGSTGGMDIVAALINYKHREFPMMTLIFSINVVVATMSFFAYGFDYVPVILCIVYSFVTTRVSDAIIKGMRVAAKFEIITSNPEDIAHDVMIQLHHGCTMLPAVGMYSHSDKSLLICVVNRLQIADFERIIAKYPGTFVIASSINRAYGNFKHIK